jgi:hypothetical protein
LIVSLIAAGGKLSSMTRPTPADIACERIRHSGYPSSGRGIDRRLADNQTAKAPDEFGGPMLTWCLPPSRTPQERFVCVSPRTQGFVLMQARTGILFIASSPSSGTINSGPIAWLAPTPMAPNPSSCACVLANAGAVGQRSCGEAIGIVTRPTIPSGLDPIVCAMHRRRLPRRSPRGERMAAASVRPMARANAPLIQARIRKAGRITADAGAGRGRSHWHRRAVSETR